MMNILINRMVFIIIMAGVGLVLISMFNNSLAMMGTQFSAFGLLLCGLTVICLGITIAVSRLTWTHFKRSGLL